MVYPLLRLITSCLMTRVVMISSVSVPTYHLAVTRTKPGYHRWQQNSSLFFLGQIRSLVAALTTGVIGGMRHLITHLDSTIRTGSGPARLALIT